MAFINRFMTAMFDVLFAPFEHAPGWVSLLVFSAVTAVAGLLVYKYTSNQDGIKRVKARIKAHTLAIKLFRDELGVMVRSLASIVLGAVGMLRYALLPMVIMIVPFVLVMAQLGQRYQWRPLVVGEGFVLRLQLADGLDAARVETSLSVGENVEEEARVRCVSAGEVLWRMRAVKDGAASIAIRVGDETVEKTVVVGSGFERVNLVRSRGDFSDSLLHPGESPVEAGNVASVRISYPVRESWVCGGDLWLVWLIGGSFVLAFAFKPVLKVEF